MAAGEGTSQCADEASADTATSCPMVSIISYSAIEISHCSRQKAPEEEFIVVQ